MNVVIKAIWLGLLTSFTSIITAQQVLAQQPKPNVVFILADNVG